MTKIRIIIFLITLTFTTSIFFIVSLYARGYRFDQRKKKFTPNGLLVIKSDPDGAQVLVNGDVKTATNATFPLFPGVYDVLVQKNGYLSWNKRLVIEKEVVTQETAHLFKSAPSLSAVTFSGSVNPSPSKDLSKIAYIVPSSLKNSEEAEGLWIMEIINLPLGFSREPRRVTDGDLIASSFLWSPDAREILLTTAKGSFLLDLSKFTPQTQRINIASQKEKILEEWNLEKQKRFKSQVSKLQDELEDIIIRKTKAVIFSPDEDMLLFTASGSASIPENLIKPITGASTQKQERNIKADQTYVYDIKEDRNFWIIEDKITLNGWIDYDLPKESGSKNPENANSKRSLSWFPTSRHLVFAEEGKIVIMDYDGTNRQVVYAGSFLAPHAFPALSHDRLIILTNLGASSTPTNLYSLSIK